MLECLGFFCTSGLFSPDIYKNKVKKLGECFAWLSHGRMPQRIPLLKFKSFTNSCYLPRFTTTEKQNHKSLMKNAAYAGIPWRMCSTFYLAVVHWHRLSTYRGITMLSRSYQARQVTEVTEVGYTCQLFLRYKREIFILGVLGFLKTTRSFPKIPEEIRSLPKKSEVFRRRPKSSEDV